MNDMRALIARMIYVVIGCFVLVCSSHGIFATQSILIQTLCTITLTYGVAAIALGFIP
jgi:hypothetical protein